MGSEWKACELCYNEFPSEELEKFNSDYLPDGSAMCCEACAQNQARWEYNREPELDQDR